MSIWISWLLISILFFISEIFFLSWDFFALGIASLITSFVFKIFWFYFQNYNLYLASSFVFLFSAIISWFIVKYFVKKYQNKSKYKKTFSNEQIIWQHLIVQEVNGDKVCYFEGIYWPIYNADDVDIGDQVEVVDFKNNEIIVKKLI